MELSNRNGSPVELSMAGVSCCCRRRGSVRGGGQRSFLLICACALVLCALLSTADATRVNCRKFVFAPICRGVAAKRNFNSEDAYSRKAAAELNFDMEYPVGPEGSSSNPGSGLVRELLQRRRKHYRQPSPGSVASNSVIPEQETVDTIDPAIYDYK